MEPTPSFYEHACSANPAFWTNGGFRKRKAAVSDLDDKSNAKVFATEEKMVKDMRTLSLDINANNTTPLVSSEPLDEEVIADDMKPELISQGSETSDGEINQSPMRETADQTWLEYHPTLQNSLKQDGLNDRLLTKLCEMERRKLTMQLVPYIPIHPSQLKSDSTTTKTESKSSDEEEKRSLSSSSSSSSLPSTAAMPMFDEFSERNEDHLFKRPWLPTPYTVEEPSETISKRCPTMKRSFSQCNQYNSNLSVTELKYDTKDDLALSQSPTNYFIVEPTVSPLISSTSSGSNSSGGLSSRISEYVDPPIAEAAPGAPTSFDLAADDDIDMQSVASSDTGDKMDDD